MPLCCIALGANLGDPEFQFASALSALNAAGQDVVKVSGNYRTSAMGENAGGDFLNAAAVVDANIPPEEFLLLLHQIEADLGRERTISWGPRLLDLDLQLYVGQVIESNTLVVPHPALWYRRFVLQPLNEIAADWIHPTFQMSVAELHGRLNQLPLEFSLAGHDESVRADLFNRLSERFCCECFRLHGDSDSSVNTFAMVETSASSTASHLERICPSQPRLESKRTIRSSVANASIEDLFQLLHDVLTAALPADKCR